MALRPWAGCVRCAVLFLALCSPWGVSPTAMAEEGAADPSVSLEQLLKLPDSYSAGSSARRGGADATEWRSRFSKARQRISAAQTALAEAKQRMKGLAGDSAQWQASAPGVGGDPSQSPISFGAREKLRESREELDAAEKALRELEVEANLGGVPETWRYPEPEGP